MPDFWGPFRSQPRHLRLKGANFKKGDPIISLVESGILGILGTIGKKPVALDIDMQVPPTSAKLHGSQARVSLETLVYQCR